MSLRHTSVVEHPIDEVFAWHGRKDAIKRLTPPWQPVRVRAGATSLRDRRAVLGLPGGLRWVAAHQPDGYSPPHRFVDQLTSLPLSAILSWRHTHEFEATDGTTTRVTDAVDTDLPGAVLRAMFTYRHAQLADDLASHARALAWRSSPVTVAVTGSSGLVGNALTALLSTGGHRVVRLVRRPARAPDEREWDPQDPAPDLLAGVDAVIHLAGDSVPGRSVNAQEASVLDVRTCPTRLLAQRAANTAKGPSAFVSASAVGYYGAGNGDEILTEASPRGDGILAETVAARETATTPAAEAGLRTVNVRSGIVQSPRGGTLRPLFPLFYAGLSASVGEGDRWLPWIGLDDLTDVYLRAILDADWRGRSTPPPRTPCATASTPAHWRAPSTAQLPFRYPRWGHACCSGSEALVNWHAPTNASGPIVSNDPTTAFAIPTWKQRCGTFSANRYAAKAELDFRPTPSGEVPAPSGFAIRWTDGCSHGRFPIV